MNKNDFSDLFNSYRRLLGANPGGGGMLPESAVIWLSLLSAQSRDKLRGDLAEIGVYKGYGAALLAAASLSTERILLIDKFFSLDYSKEIICSLGGVDALQKIKFVQNDSFSLRRVDDLCGLGELRFFHIDGEHSYDAVINDLELALRHIAPHGVIAVDDFFNNAAPAITQAVFDYVGQRGSGFSIFLIGYNKAYLCSNRWLGHYRSICVNLLSILEDFGYRAQLAAGGFAFERTYVGISPRVTESCYQLIGSFIDSSEKFASATNRYV